MELSTIPSDRWVDTGRDDDDATFQAFQEQEQAQEAASNEYTAVGNYQSSVNSIPTLASLSAESLLSLLPHNTIESLISLYYGEKHGPFFSFVPWVKNLREVISGAHPDLAESEIDEYTCRLPQVRKCARDYRVFINDISRAFPQYEDPGFVHQITPRTQPQSCSYLARPRIFPINLEISNIILDWAKEMSYEHYFTIIKGRKGVFVQTWRHYWDERDVPANPPLRMSSMVGITVSEKLEGLQVRVDTNWVYGHSLIVLSGVECLR